MTVRTGDSYVHEANYFLTTVLDLAKANSAPIHDSSMLSVARHYTDSSRLSRCNLSVTRPAYRIIFPWIPDSSREFPSDSSQIEVK
jgi:hypothetical protein